MRKREGGDNHGGKCFVEKLNYATHLQKYRPAKMAIR